MRVAILSREFPPAPSGIGDHTDRLASELTARHHEVTVVCSPPADLRSSVDVQPVVPGWERDDVPLIAGAIARTEPQVIVWQYNPFSIGRKGLPASAPSLARALSTVAPLVVFAHELWFPWGRAGARGLAWAVAQRRAARAVLRHAAAVVVTTEERERAVAGLTRRVERIPVGSNVEVAAFSAREALGVGDTAFVIGHLGGVGPGKEFGPVWAALRRLREAGIDARLLLAGRSPAFTPPPEVAAAVIATGETADLSPYLNAMDVYLHPDPAGPSVGRRTSLGAALAHGLPLVAYRGPDHASELVHGHNVIVVEPDAGALAAVLGKLYAEPDTRAKLAEAARRTSDASFSWRKIGDSIEGLLVELSR